MWRLLDHRRRAHEEADQLLPWCPAPGSRPGTGAGGGLRASRHTDPHIGADAHSYGHQGATDSYRYPGSNTDRHFDSTYPYSNSHSEARRDTSTNPYSNRDSNSSPSDTHTYASSNPHADPSSSAADGYTYAYQGRNTHAREAYGHPHSGLA